MLGNVRGWTFWRGISTCWQKIQMVRIALKMILYPEAIIQVLWVWTRLGSHLYGTGLIFSVKRKPEYHGIVWVRSQPPTT